MPTFAIDIEARFAKFQDALNRVERDTARMAGRMESAFAGVRKTMVGLGALAAGGAIAGSLRRAVDDLDKLGKAAQRTGLSVERLSALEFGAALADIDFDSLTQGLTKFSIALANDAEAFKKLGIDIKGLSSDQALGAVADKFAKMGPSAARAARSAELFGRELGGRMIPFMKDGSAGLAEMTREAERFGYIVRTEAADGADQLGDSLDKVRLQAEGTTRRMASAMLPGLIQIGEAAAEAARKYGLLSAALAGLEQVGKIALFGVDPGELQQAQDRVDELRQSIEQTKAALAAGERGDVGFVDEFGRALTSTVADSKRKLAELTFTLKDAEAVLKRLQDAAKPKPGGDGASIGGEAKEDPRAKQFAAHIESLRKLATGYSDLGHAQQAEVDISEQRFGKLSVAQQTLLRGLAQEVDTRALLTDERERGQQTAKQEMEDSAAAARTAMEDRQRQAQSWRQLVDPIGAASAEIAKFNELQASPEALGAADAARAQMVLRNRQIEASFNALNADILDSIDPARRLYGELRRIGELRVKGQDVTGLTPEQIDEYERRVNRTIQQLDPAEEFRDLADPTRRIRDAREELDRLKASLSPEHYQRAAQVLERDLVEALAEMGDRAAQTQLVMEHALVDPLEDFITKAKSADDAAKAFFETIARSLLRLELERFSKDLFGGLFGTDSGSLLKTGAGFFGGLFGGGGAAAASNADWFASGGVMTPQGPLKLERYATGGVAIRPQLALFGEGRRPEAYVPLPDGRSIPVTMTGGGRGVQAGPSAVLGKNTRPLSVKLDLRVTPEARSMTMADWLDGQIAREMAGR